MPSSLATREPLMARLDAASACRLVALTAPAGSGKTTLLSQWHAKASRDRCVAWLSVNEHTGSLRMFFAHLHAALARCLPGFGPIGDDSPCVPADAAAMLAEQLAQAGHAITIVLDGVECLTDPSLTQAIDSLLRDAPESVHWIVSGRGVHCGAISQLQLQDQCTVIGARELALSSAEVGALGLELMGRPLGDAEIDFILRVTEGWCAGVKFALLSAYSGTLDAHALMQFSGSHRQIATYFEEIVLAHLPADVRDVLLTTAVADTLCGDLCNVLAGVSDGGARLEHMVQSQCFVQALDDHGHWYRYHPLLLDHLREQLKRKGADRVASLHMAASRWLDEHGLPYRALPHAFESHDRAWCLEVMERCAFAWMKDGEPLEVLRWAALLTKDEIVSRSDICCAYVLSLVLSHRYIEASSILRLAMARAFSLGDGAGSESRDTDLYRFKVLGRMLNGESFGVRQGEPLSPRSDGASEDFFEGILIASQSSTLLTRNQFEAARRLAMRARDLGQRSVSPYLVSHAETLICAAEFQQGHLRSAAQASERNFAALKGKSQSPAWVNAAVTLACARYERGRLGEARTLLLEVLPHVTASSTLWVFSAAHIVLARLHAIDQQPGKALELLDGAHSVLEDAGHPRYLAEICFEKVRLNLEQNDLVRAETAASEFSLRERVQDGEWQQARQYDESWGRYGFASALLSMHQGDCGAARSMLEVLRDSADEAGRVARRATLDMALAMCHWHMGHDKAAYDVLNKHMVPTKEIGFSRAIFDEVPRFSTLLRAAIAAGKLSYMPPTRYFRDLAGMRLQRPGTPRMAPPSAVPLREPLTEREVAIVELLSKGLCNKSISQCSGITLNTIKWHLRNVFAKLDATSRTGAVARARELRLID